MLLSRVDPRIATALRLAGLLAIGWSVFASQHAPAGSGRGLAVAVLLAVACGAWVVWTARAGREHGITPELYVLATAGGLLCGACPDSAASAFVFVAVLVAGVRAELAQAAPVVAAGTIAVAIAFIVYGGSALGALAYGLGFTLTLLAASTRRQSAVRAEQAELLLAQTQRSHEEQLRSARLEEAARIARELHDVLAHALAGLTIQLEATSALLEQGADREVLAARLGQAHELAREGMRDARRAVGALRGDEAAFTPAAIEALVDDYRASTGAPATVTIDAARARLDGATRQELFRVTQEALTNVRKHAPGAPVAVTLRAGEQAGQELVLTIDNQPGNGRPASAPDALAASGAGYGLRGMRERATLLGGTLEAGANGDGWRVQLRLPPGGRGDEGTGRCT